METADLLAHVPSIFRAGLAAPLEMLMAHINRLEQRIAELERTTTGETK